MAIRSQFIAKPGDFEKLSTALKGLPSTVANKILSKALRAGGNIIANEAKARAPVGKYDKRGKYPHKAGDLRRSIRVRTGKTRNKGERKVIVLVGAENQGGKWFNIYYPWFVEFGHKIGAKDANKAKRGREKRIKTLFLQGKLFHKTWSKQVLFGSQRKDVAPRPFYRPAFDNKKGEARAAMTQMLREGIDAAWKAAKP